ncbi:hypothetical protein M6D93_12295 [Jatrophihabitans telluris]|uniref:DUF222 domain-containing protein n=1 Tax=Jatrophihabitans telluris TaxID=2038343 RepID=A0ABY4QVC7_9ACTN|nr:hypothetical protein [Jatrophihabitans telluris]UQX87082.1 hypothetical protein M6D93_12295 [Jatrophihabitans telluris]
MTAAEITTVPLSRADEATLHELEAVISTGLDTFIQVGLALAEVRDSKLYRATHHSFAAYVEDRFEIGRSRAYQLMDAAKMVAEMSTIVDTHLPTSEGQVRALAGLAPAQAAAVMAEVSSITAAPTAATIATVRAHRFPKQGQLPRAATMDNRVDTAPLTPLVVDDEAEEIDDPLIRLSVALEELEREERWIQRAALAQVDVAVTASFFAEVLRQLVDEIHQRRNEVDPFAKIIAEVTALFPKRKVEHDLESVYLSIRDKTMNPATVKTRLIERYTEMDRIALVEVRDRSAIVWSGWPQIRGVLNQLGVSFMRDLTTGKMSFPAVRAADVQAAGELARINLVLRSVVPDAAAPRRLP